MEEAGAGTLADTKASGAATTSIGNAEMVCWTICVAATRLSTCTVGVTTTNTCGCANSLEAEAVGVAKFTAVRETCGASTRCTHQMVACCKCLTWDNRS